MKVAIKYLIEVIILSLAFCQNMNNPTGADPAVGYDATEGAMVRHIYSTLIEYIGKMEPLASQSSWTTTPTIDIAAGLPAGTFDDDE